jgi:hypothetical protein
MGGGGIELAPELGEDRLQLLLIGGGLSAVKHCGFLLRSVLDPDW